MCYNRRSFSLKSQLTSTLEDLTYKENKIQLRYDFRLNVENKGDTLFYLYNCGLPQSNRDE